MTSFTKRLGTPFTLPRKRSERGSASQHGLEDDGRTRTTRAVCGGGEPEREEVRRLMPGVWHLASDRNVVAATLRAGRAGGDRRAQSAAAAESDADLRGVGAAGGGDAAALSGLGSAQAASVAGRGGSGADAQHGSSHSAAAGSGSGERPASAGAAAL